MNRKRHPKPKKGFPKPYLLFLLFIFVLCSCGNSQESESSAEDPELNFPKTTWNMSSPEVMDAYSVTEDDVNGYYSAGRSISFAIPDLEIFGEQSASAHFSFINLSLGASQNMQDFDEASADGKEVLASVTVAYPAGTDMEHVVKEMNQLYGKQSLSEISVFSLYDPLGTNTLYEQQEKETDTQKVWGNDTVASRISPDQLSFFRENWPIYQSNMTEDDWETFSEKGRMVTILCSMDQKTPYIQFEAYNLAVYHELEKRNSSAG